MRSALLLVLLAASVGAEPVLFQQSRFDSGTDGVPEGWLTWSPREEIAPRTFVDGSRSRGGAGALVVAGDSNPAEFGGWRRTIDGVRAGEWYRLTAHYLPDGVKYESLEILARIDWQSAGGEQAGRQEYAYKVERDGDWRRLVLEAPAPKEAVAATIELYLVNAPQATVWWDDITLERINPPGARSVRVAAVNLRPRDTGSKDASLGMFLHVVKEQVPEDADVILLPEGITVVGSGKTYAEVAEPIPGPTTEKLGEVARFKNAYLAAGVYERERNTVYNTAVLLDRQGRLVGKYRKVYLPREEFEGGLTPGSDYPVFDTDFGRVGMMICWDVQYADPARALALRGAELLLMPIWGGDETLAKARAIENHVFLATSGYDFPTYVMDPKGETLALASEQGAVALTTIDLNKRYVDSWLGYMRGRFFNELRTDVPVVPPR